MSQFRTLDLAVAFHDRAERTPVKGHLRDQLVRAATSIALNLSEGNAKPSVKEKKRFFQTAYASAQECKTILVLAKSRDQQAVQMVDQLAASIYKLVNSKLSILRPRNSEPVQDFVDGDPSSGV